MTEHPTTPAGPDDELPADQPVEAEAGAEPTDDRPDPDLPDILKQTTA